MSKALKKTRNDVPVERSLAGRCDVDPEVLLDQVVERINEVMAPVYAKVLTDKVRWAWEDSKAVYERRIAELEREIGRMKGEG
jgi:adenylate kinase family enzyme